MIFAILNESTGSKELTRDVLERIAQACTRQLNECYAPLWESAGGSVFVADALATVPETVVPVVILDNADQADALGYHATAPNGRPYARIFLAPILDNGGSLLQGGVSLSATVSHEVLEADADPYVGFWADMPDGRQLALEVGDPVEADAYDIDGVSVSNFVGPRYFSNGPGPYDWMGKLPAPFAMTAGGYQIVRDTTGNVSQVFGEAYPEWKKSAKAHAAARTSKRAHRA